MNFHGYSDILLHSFILYSVTNNIIDYFDLVKCEVKGQEFKKCGNSCPPTCEAPNPIPCTKDCVSGCQCRKGLVFDEENNRCVNKKDCDM